MTEEVMLPLMVMIVTIYRGDSMHRTICSDSSPQNCKAYAAVPSLKMRKLRHSSIPKSLWSVEARIYTLIFLFLKLMFFPQKEPERQIPPLEKKKKFFSGTAILFDDNELNINYLSELVAIWMQ